MTTPASDFAFKRLVGPETQTDVRSCAAVGLLKLLTGAEGAS